MRTNGPSLKSLLPHRGQRKAFTVIFDKTLTKDDEARLKDVVRTFFDGRTSAKPHYRPKGLALRPNLTACPPRGKVIPSPCGETWRK